MKRVEGGTKVGTMIERTAAAINHQARVMRNALRPSPQIGESRLGLRGAMKHRARHMGAHIQRAKTNAHDNRLRGTFRVVELFQEVSGLNGLRRGPRVGGNAGRSRIRLSCACGRRREISRRQNYRCEQHRNAQKARESRLSSNQHCMPPRQKNTAGLLSPPLYSTNAGKNSERTGARWWEPQSSFSA